MDTSNAWNVYTRVNKHYPVISQTGGGFGISLAANGVQIGSGTNKLTQFKNQDSTSIIQLSSNLLTVNRLPKYQGWESYSKMIIEAINNLYEVLDISNINRIGLRTINKIDIHTHSYENFKQSFNVYPSLPAGIDNNLNSIQINYETPVESNKDILAIKLNTLRKEPNYEAPVLFQLYYTKLDNIERTSIEDWLEKAHKKLHTTFENIITPERKRDFNNG